MSKLFECVEILDSKRIPLSSKVREGLAKIYPYYGAQGIVDYVDNYLFDGDYILVAEDGNNLKTLSEPITTWATGRFWVNNHAHILGEKKGYCLKYIYYLLTCMDLRGYITGSAQPKFNQENLANVELRLPELSQQISTAKILSVLDDKIINNNFISTTLESMAKTLFAYWFTQFDFPNAEGKPYRSSGGAMEWNEQLKREIPKGWCCSVIANHIGDSKGGDWGKDTLTGNYQKEVVCIRGADFPSINGGKTLNAPVRYILSKNANKTLLAGDIIVEISGGSPTQSTGRICYINDYTLRRFDKEIITSNFCKAFSTKKASEQYWLYLLWKTLYDAGVLFGFEGKTTGIKNLLFDDFCVQYRIVAPDNTVLQRFHETVSPIFEKIQQYNIENDELTKLRDWLLPMLMNGQATVVSAPFENESQIPSEPEVIEVLQAARSFSGTQSTFDDTADLVRYYKEHK